MSILEQKKELRELIRRQVTALPATYCEKADKAIWKYVTTLPEYEQAGTIFCYVGTKLEINTVPILKTALEQGKRVGVPLCVAKGIMEVRQIRKLSDLKVGSYNILEPQAGSELIKPDEIDLGLIPCCTCNEKGQRLGYGGGYYDRYLSQSGFTRAVLCRSRIMQADIPMVDYDMTMDVVISETGVMRVR